MRAPKFEPLQRRVWKAEPMPALPDDFRKLPKSRETRERMRQAQLGKKHTPEARERIRQARLGKKNTPETRERIRQAQLGKKRGPYKKRVIG